MAQQQQQPKENDGATLNILNAQSFKPTMKISEMILNNPYQIYGIRRIATKYGPRVVAELQDVQIFLPMRYSSLPDDAMEDINSKGDFYVTNSGQNGKSFELKFSQNSSSYYYYNNY